MTRIDFHFNTPEKLAYSCRLIRKAYRAQHRIWVFSDDSEQLQRLDKMLWYLQKEILIKFFILNNFDKKFFNNAIFEEILRFLENKSSIL